jgi:hypothetical protein
MDEVKRSSVGSPSDIDKVEPRLADGSQPRLRRKVPLQYHYGLLGPRVSLTEDQHEVQAEKFIRANVCQSKHQSMAAMSKRYGSAPEIPWIKSPEMSLMRSEGPFPLSRKLGPNWNVIRPWHINSFQHVPPQNIASRHPRYLLEPLQSTHD